MLRGLFLIIFLTTLPLASIADAASTEDACAGLWPSKTETKKCVDHVKLFEVPVPFINLCKSNFKDIDEKWNCIKSGANETTFKICTGLHWSQENTLTCLRAGPTKSTTEACKNFSSNEIVQVSCLRTGREVAQISACAEWSGDDNEKLDCLKMDIPAEEIRTCARRTNRNAKAAKKCLLNYVAERENNFNREMNASRQEIAAKQAEEARLKNSRMPASVKLK